MNDKHEIRALKLALLQAHIDHRKQIDALKNKLASKKRKRSLRKYGEPFAEATPQLMADAVKAYLAEPIGKRSIREAAARFNICRGRLHRAVLDARFPQDTPIPRNNATIADRHRMFLDAIKEEG
jgi:hypothetical protein